MRRMTVVKLLAVAFAGTALTGCAWLEPKLHISRPTLPATFESTENKPFVSPTVVGSWQVAQPKPAEARGAWWMMYNDAQLNTLMGQAVENNPSLHVMAARVKQARAQAGIAEAAELPQVDGNAQAQRGKTSPAILGLADSTHVGVGNLYQLGVGASYEVDLFGSISGQVRSARFGALASRDLYESARLALQAQVAEAYFNLRAATAITQAVADSLKLGEQALAISKQKSDLGEISTQDYQLALANLMTLRNEALGLENTRQQARTQLMVLTGGTQVSVDDSQPLAGLPPEIPAGVPSTVLERRPDVAAAEHELMSANADIGVARAAFFPSLSLTANGGYASENMGNLFKWNSSTWAVGPLVSLPIFHGGELLSNLRFSHAKYEEAVANYRGQILSAFKDVADALEAQRLGQQQAEGQRQAAAELKKAAEMSRLQYEAGDLSRPDYIASQQAALAALINEQQSELAAFTASAELVRALGGGW